VRVRLWAASKAIEYEVIRDEASGLPRPASDDVGPALIAAIGRLREGASQPKVAPEIIPPSPRPAARKATGPVSDATDAQPPEPPPAK
jgi:hypothetical protein